MTFAFESAARPVANVKSTTLAPCVIELEHFPLFDVRINEAEIRPSAAKLALECTARQRRREWCCGLLGRLCWLGGRLCIGRLIGRRRGGALADDLLRLGRRRRRC